MSANVLDGKQVAKTIKNFAKIIIKRYFSEDNKPTLAVILVGNDQASEIYVRQKENACAEVGLNSKIIRFDEKTQTNDIIEEIEKLNKDDNVSGIMVQLPLPKTVDKDLILNSINPIKDVDGFTKENISKLYIGEDGLKPCTPHGIMTMLAAHNINVSGKHVVIVGRSNIVGKPLALLMLQANATVTICHSKTKNLAEITSHADILIAAVGKANLITADMVKQDAIVVDVGINRINGKLCGDVDYENVKELASWITPVPGGVGPVTVAMLMFNTSQAALNMFDDRKLYELVFNDACDITEDSK